MGFLRGRDYRHVSLNEKGRAVLEAALSRKEEK
jgi:hypothetical protein